MSTPRPALKRTFVCPLLRHPINRGVESATKRPAVAPKAAPQSATPAGTKSLTSLRGTAAPTAEPPTTSKPPAE